MNFWDVGGGDFKGLIIMVVLIYSWFLMGNDIVFDVDWYYYLIYGY